MKVKIVFVLLVLTTVFLYNKCGNKYVHSSKIKGLATRNCGTVNVSVRIPKEWKHMKKKQLNELKNNDVNPITGEKINTGEKIDGYVYTETDMGVEEFLSYIIIRQWKLKDINPELAKLNIKSIKAFAKVLNYNLDEYGDAITNINGTDCIIEQDTMNDFKIVAFKNNLFYEVSVSANYTGDYDEYAVQSAIKDTIKFGTNGVINGAIDGFLFPVKFIVHWFNKEIRFYAVSNNGISYIIAFVIGVFSLLVVLTNIIDN